MDIKTKADIGDITYFLADNKVVTAVVRHINIEVTEQSSQFGSTTNIVILYSTDTSNKVYEKDIFLTKQDLLDSL